ncbi:MAG: hypothetical protein WA194_06740 [Patescibacteria group bacterium]
MKLAGECQDGLPISISEVSKLAEKFEIAQVAEVKMKAEIVAEKKTEVAEKKTEEFAQVAKEMRDRISKYPGMSEKYEQTLAKLESGKLDVESKEAKIFAHDILSDLKKSFEDAKANGGDTSKAAEDLRFFAEKFRDLGVISHQDFRDLFKNDSQKSSPDTNKSPVDGRTALAGNFNSTGDGRTFFALDRTYLGV